MIRRLTVAAAFGLMHALPLAAQQVSVTLPPDAAKAQALFQQWIDSRTHRKNMLNRSFRFVSTGVIARGKLDGSRFVAEEVLAKHDENYMPPEVADSLKPHMDAANNAPESNTTATAPAPGST